MMQFTTISLCSFAVLISLVQQSEPTAVSRVKRFCGQGGCSSPPLCAQCPVCCNSAPAPLPPPPPPALDSCCNAPRPNPGCCQTRTVPVPSIVPPFREFVIINGTKLAVSPTVSCCKAAPAPANPCCQALIQPPPPPPQSSCCAAAPVPANPCCQGELPPPPPPPCMCQAPRPIPCRCSAPVMECPNCGPPPPRCSPMVLSCRLSFRMRRDVHQSILSQLSQMGF